ncbi:LysM peptidoglycan-binding domain-containing protein (plasmid) [Sinorhizobium meliloti]|uniref:LysM peptidoglycan-binding domain-containing protein n=1 Tax=Rhizobium meliloti TaxID=382 RepID=UPI002D76C8FC|nr:LysM peptidoglycan-binding domain-containing protein [Sinorhizobium meliloti]WRQ71904.1 LysM peptidoglycan-binding domain-containing protein [Sinorhizobium meliloti]
MLQLKAKLGMLAVTLFAVSPTVAAQVCGKTEVVDEGETLEQLAARCETTVDAVLSANPALDADDIQAGLQLKMPESAEGDWLSRARQAVSVAGERVNEAAEAAGRSVSDYLSDQPDLNRDILEMGERLGLPGVSTSQSRGAELMVIPKDVGPGDKVDLNANGLPGGVEVTMGVRIGDESDFRAISRARTNEAGLLEATVPVPEQAQKGDEIAFAVETVDGRVRVVSEPFNVGPTTD